MAENTIILDADVKPLRKQLREATEELQMTRQKFGEFSTEAVTAAQKVAGIRDEIDAANEAAQLFDPGKRFQALTTAASTAAGGIAAAQGALALFGGQSEEVEKSLLKVQGALALSQGLSELKDIGKVGEQLKTTFKGLTLGANTFKKALISTGIGALVVAVGLLVAYWDDILALVGGVSTEQKKLNESTKLDLQAQEEKLNAIDGQTNQLKLQGKTEEEILQLKMDQTDEAIKAAEVNLANSIATKDAQIAASERNKAILSGIIKGIFGPISLILGAVDMISKGLKAIGVLEESTNLLDGSTDYLASFVFDPEAVGVAGDATIKEAKEGLNKLKEQRAGFELSKIESSKAAAEKGRAEREKQNQKDNEAQDKINEENDKKLKDDAQNEAAFQKQLNDIRTQTKLDAIKDENEKASQQILIGFEKQRKEVLDNEKLTADQKTALVLALKDQEDQALAALQQTIAEADAIAEIEALDKQMDADNLSLQMEKDLLDQKEKLNQQFYDLGLISEEEFNANKKKNSEARKALDKEEYDFRIARAQEASMVLGQLSELAGKQTAAGKALGIAAALTNTYVGVTEALATKSVLPSPFDIVAKVANVATVLAAGLKAVRAITAVKVPGGGGGGGGVSAPSIGGGAPSTASAVPTIGTSPVTALGTMMANQPPLKAYVVESEVTGTQKRVADIERRAGF